MTCKLGWQRSELGSKTQNLALCMYRKGNWTMKSYMNVYGILKKYYSNVSKRNTPHMDAATTKLYSVLTWDANLGTSWEL